MDQKKAFNFSVSGMTEHQIGCIEFVLNSPAYVDVFEPYLVSMRDSLNHRMLDRSKGRKEEFSDDFLAGGIVAIDGLLALFKRLIQETQADRAIESQLSVNPENAYAYAAAHNQHDPVLGANEQPLVEGSAEDEYDPAQDY